MKNILGHPQVGNFEYKIFSLDIPFTFNFHNFISWNISVTGRNAVNME